MVPLALPCFFFPDGRSCSMSTILIGACRVAAKTGHQGGCPPCTSNPFSDPGTGEAALVMWVLLEICLQQQPTWIWEFHGEFLLRKNPNHPLIRRQCRDSRGKDVCWISRSFEMVIRWSYETVASHGHIGLVEHQCTGPVVLGHTVGRASIDFIGARSRTLGTEIWLHTAPALEKCEGVQL